MATNASPRKKTPMATFDVPDYEHPRLYAASVRWTVTEAEWARGETAIRGKINKVQMDEAPVTCLGVARFSEIAVQRLSGPIEGAAIQINIRNRYKAHIGIELVNPMEYHLERARGFPKAGYQCLCR